MRLVRILISNSRKDLLHRIHGIYTTHRIGSMHHVKVCDFITKLSGRYTIKFCTDLRSVVISSHHVFFKAPIKLLVVVVFINSPLVGHCVRSSQNQLSSVEIIPHGYKTLQEIFISHTRNYGQNILLQHRQKIITTRDLGCATEHTILCELWCSETNLITT